MWPWQGSLPPGMSGGSSIRWELAKTISLAQWNAALAAGKIDIGVVPSGTVLYDVAAIPHREFNDLDGDAATIGPFGWGFSAGSFAWNFSPAFNTVQYQVGHTSVFTQAAGLEVARLLVGDSVPLTNSLNAYGPPAFVTNGPAMGPLQAMIAGAGDSTGLGNIKVWWLIGNA